jgi:hypothetical protein
MVEFFDYRAGLARATELAYPGTPTMFVKPVKPVTKPDILDKLQAAAEAKANEPETFDGMELDKLFASAD